MSLIDTTYFVRDINVPLSSNQVLNSTFTNSILRYEDEVLKKLLGYNLWKEFTDALAAATEEAPLAQKWVDLRDGKAFTFEWFGNTVNTYWNGLINADKVSLISFYVYYQHRVNHESEYTGIGEVVAKSENSVRVNPLNKLVRVHTQMLDLYGRIPAVARKYYQFLDNSDYQHYNADASAYNFLLANRETYPNWVFKPIGSVNSFGI